MNTNVRKMCFNGIICAVYILLTMLNPLSYGMLQIRISEGLALLPFYDRKYITPIVLGVAIANFFSPLGLLDVIAGLLVAAIAYSLSKYIKNIIVNAVIYACLCGLIIGAELYYVVNAPFLMTSLSIFASQIIIAIISMVILKPIVKRSEV